ncbi:hypothetical protein BJ508DRAFT_79857 [Ascobolus immersus RN42]|uniref:Uncharacterized protein n=1 Tax=Ascobolus immersus RN42 TaxID=1160509 RepID=A0A3N4HEQ2_ASCIM|nr:hypothetical protein BJ508DRAFT_79857 [Ascobolus immersus RN42]
MTAPSNMNHRILIIQNAMPTDQVDRLRRLASTPHQPQLNTGLPSFFQSFIRFLRSSNAPLQPPPPNRKDQCRQWHGEGKIQPQVFSHCESTILSRFRLAEEVHSKQCRDECPGQEEHCEDGYGPHGITVLPGINCDLCRLFSHPDVEETIFLS